MTSLLNAWTWVVTILLVLVGFVVVTAVFLVTAPFDPGRYAAGRAFRLLGVAQVKLNPFWRFRTSGTRVTDPRRPYVAVANHESYADIFLISHLPWDMKWLSKDTIFKIPVMGWMMSMAGDVRLTRGDRSSAARAIAACRDRLAKRVSVMIFPEGTRSRGGELLPFKDGAFRLAIEAGVPILPIAVAGTRHAMAKGSFRFRRANAICHVLEPIPTEGLSLADVPDLRDRVRALLMETRHRLEHELGLASTTRATVSATE
ncbi:MAG TPA: lysophospholipid acyltransferase family protein [Gemmatimonadaceae bacterium]|jgi:1-acyl-sn-glycerol-3-phosphate acyltransferase|nr:lysophospholipid acyltransferase family protein [Gemmatimonadaceae bacterium]